MAIRDTCEDTLVINPCACTGEQLLINPIVSAVVVTFFKLNIVSSPFYSLIA